jgi:hypothetical protein
MILWLISIKTLSHSSWWIIVIDWPQVLMITIHLWVCTSCHVYTCLIIISIARPDLVLLLRTFKTWNASLLMKLSTIIYICENILSKPSCVAKKSVILILGLWVYHMPYINIYLVIFLTYSIIKISFDCVVFRLVNPLNLWYNMFFGFFVCNFLKCLGFSASTSVCYEIIQFFIWQVH